ncbi:MAG: excinuclease ABC subunit B [Candidatus Yanofskybacteria bacterium RIFCSPLOWO2_02_FULL_43_10]|uniref:UvrABC system protein B n=1 Tax=Candidatus Yanofskybacteria bacterium RIFCSPLOWO2_12_FULL_43_11b TaxID=1802710 RepID=A0A1F8H974_9BACT|nr:MAG: excinuclease ABC subunit B [Candidatus Yanofskybacteria bacterium RIFCSPHIGHO2_01_FULL_43_32]OGN11263.1 MAG: excinuclease ABC subunit B [Candidatus Yanofskybacteria bacterium RIFCSPHIGHO2_02_FULL_43_12]OGN17621.1 MAG: excinuclease ABC subunit B [Candidatus Yanofskybacteria bacterium RIFCSPHIGHO2_12_FULL_43_11]OGN24184.1 MAG: excinuclease ABC subunit B [Candidatus Yanofskybacteria bacterium RIFCSPLOWO2_01_FULL_43_46]OGN29734.1 MAG: excinuclease ABC subunit B [Candidatus Yanofskybacteria 
MFKLNSKFQPTGDQPAAIAKLIGGLKSGQKHQVLLGVTGSGKTFTMAKVIEYHKKPTLIISHNKTLAAQLYKEFKEFFPKNAVHYFVSYYDYYQPEAYIPHTDTYIEKDSKINQEIDRLRHAATQALISRDDVIIVASVSCIYNLGSPEDYKNLGLQIFENKKMSSQELVRGLLRLQYIPDIELKRGCFRKTTDEVEIVAPSAQEVIKIKFRNEKIEKILRAIISDPEELEMKDLKYEKIVETSVFPAKYWITSDDKIGLAIENIKSELQKHVKHLKKEKKFEEASRLQEKTLQDIEMMRQTGYCHGIENYSRHLDFRKEGEPPYSLLDFFLSKGEFLTIIDESHITIPQLRSMFTGDHSRKSTLVDYGFRLPSAIDNRPLKFPEFQKRIQKTIYTSATPAKYEMGEAGKEGIAEQLIRPTGLLDPTIEIRPTEGQILHLVENIKTRTKNGERVIVTTLTKRMAEDLAEHLAEQGIKVNYLHSEIKTLERLKILKDLRLGNYDVLVGVNLLREGLDLPEVSLIAILDADKEGFLRNATTLIQTMGRAARNVNGHVIMYADKITKSIDFAVKETQRRRKKQEKHNKENGITPRTIIKEIGNFDLPISQKEIQKYGNGDNEIIFFTNGSRQNAMKQLQKMMDKAIRKMDYETALGLKEQIRKLKSESAV